MKNIIYLIAVATWVAVLPSHADLFTPGAWLYEDGPATKPVITAWTQPNESGDGAYLWMTVDATNPFAPTLKADTGTIGASHRWFIVDEDTIIDPDFVSSATPFGPWSGGETTMGLNTPFFMGFNIYYGGAGPYEDLYGWAELKWDGSSLQLLDSAAENSGTGIIAGKYEVVPEPSTILLFGIGGGGAWLLRRNKTNLPKI